MRFSFRLKQHFFSAFRELFIHHHTSLQFRAKVFALLIAVDADASIETYIVIKKMSVDIYKNDEDRANLLMLSTKELVRKVNTDNGIGVDALIANIQKELKVVPRYAKKIDIESLKQIIALTIDEDTKKYQESIIYFLETLKKEAIA